MKEQAKNIFSKAGGYMLVATIAFFMLQVGVLLTQVLYGVSNFTLVVVLVFGTLLSYMLLKDEATEEHKTVGLVVIKLAITVFIVSCCSHVFVEIIDKIGREKEGVVAIARLNLLMDLFLSVMMIVYFKREKTVELFKSIRDESIYEKFRFDKSEPTLEAGDVMLCTTTDTEKPVIWRFKDRFLHMLILGPTGSGKTSQTILPLINQDMQNSEAGLTILEPKGDLAEKVYAMAEHYGRKAVYFNPILPNCPYFNPLYGKEEEVVENMATTFKMLNPGSPQFFLDQNETLIRNSLKVLKRLYGNKANLIELSRLVHNSGGLGRKMVTSFSRLATENLDIAKENADIASWFLNDYFNEKSKTYEHCSGLRSQVAKITDNKHLRRVLNPPNGENDVDFDKHLEEGGVITISTAQGALRDLGKFLGYFVILQFQSSVFRRPGNEFNRRPHFLYIDEFQTYSNPGFADMLTQGRSYRVASHLATQNRALIGMNSGNDGKNFIELVSTNARNVVIYPGANATDAKYYSEQFGQEMRSTTQVGITRQKFNPLKGIKPMNYDSESIRETEKLEYRFTPSDIIYRPFGEVTYCLIENNSISLPGTGTIEYIPRDLNEKLDQMVEEYTKSVFSKDEHHTPNSQIEMGLEEVVEPDVVVSPAVAKAVKNEKEDMKRRNRDVVDRSDDFQDDAVVSADSKSRYEAVSENERVYSQPAARTGQDDHLADQMEDAIHYQQDVEDDFL